MHIDHLIREVEVIEVVGDAAALEVKAIDFDSRQVSEGSLFCCLPGEHSDGHDHAAEALERGAAALLVERRLDLRAPQVVVGPGQARPAMALAACAFFGHPARSLVMAGVTGTNGKTTVSHLLGSVLEAGGMPAAVVGTLGGERTTPEAPVLQSILARALDHEKRAAVTEVSSHALVQARVDGFRYDIALFTNLSHEHLDFHGTMERYYAAKATLFTPAHAARGVVDTRSEWGRRLAGEASVPVEEVTEHDVSDVLLRRDGASFTWRGQRVEIALPGDFNVWNAVLAAEAAASLGVDESDIAVGLASAGSLAGRFEAVGRDAPFAAYVDFAHTPHALEATLGSARRIARDHQVIVVFGCGGERDRDKRRLMGKVAAVGADLVVVTTDNPRSEDPAAIAEEILSGVGEGARVLVELDRAAAIAAAVARAEPGDVLVVAGKGHETTIERATSSEPFDDRAVLEAAIQHRMPAGSRAVAG
ncbi:MAG: UDP-N-acetylmuramoyl-L-alanyl-D-glutamate--2,6-diaminopimelate ligase [Acidimicrobiales bacterium]|jgi:UDP-N-acetylmuramoyl-L-alanyl-D-glutamate--2,6-diaminopimelate ligase|nr:UDP-N-acetylmuramoyl-L-alanyl-D-glutamate--2,6-diaminopimelate ligase [Actinomycetota bacterium]MDA8184214.1 UDP-N-acetylmuramoyl-L-alanyl-D-glutamate--2,6-diaminopimelate ligase [Actinomycetota bacterium]